MIALKGFVRTLNGNDQAIKSLPQLALAHLILRFRGDPDSISTASVLLKWPEAYDDNIKGYVYSVDKALALESYTILSVSPSCCVRQREGLVD